MKKMTENKGKLIELTKNILPQLLFQTITIVFIALSSFMFMTWLVTDIFGVKDTYEAAGYSSLGTLVIFILTLAPLNAVLHRKRVKEVTTLYDAIRSVADGNYSIRIPQDSKGTITPIYSSFNKMCAELESVSLLRNDFINNYSHEFKTPIASINGFASLLLEKNYHQRSKNSTSKSLLLNQQGCPT
jgi:signal transduction histidine kinase